MRTSLRNLAIGIALVAAAGEAARSWGAGRPMFAVPVADDFVMAVLLLVAAARAARREGPTLLAGAFGFAAGMLYGSFVGHLQALRADLPDPGNLSQACLTISIGLLLFGAMLGFVLSVREAFRVPVASRPAI